MKMIESMNGSYTDGKFAREKAAYPIERNRLIQC